MLMTAAGIVPPARVFVVGAAVAGLQAITTARRYGANLFATDVRRGEGADQSIRARSASVSSSSQDASSSGYAKELWARTRRASASCSPGSVPRWTW